MRCLLVLTTCLLLAGVAAAQTLLPNPAETIGLEFIEASYENASPLYWEVDDEGNIHVFLTHDQERSTPNRATTHWHFRVLARKGSRQTIILNNLLTIWNSKYITMAMPGRRNTWQISHDGKNWSPTTTEVLPGDRLKLTVTMESGKLWIARIVPYTLTDLNALLDSIRDNPMVGMTEIGKTVEGRPLEMLRIGREDAPHRLVLRARAHPWEAGGNWVMQGLIRKLLSGDEEARRCLERYVVYILPMANKDGVVRGRSRFNLNGMDLNRGWDKPADPVLNPENHALEQWFERMIADGRKPDLYIDFHNDSNGMLSIRYPPTPDPEFEARMARYIALMEKHTWFTEGVKGRPAPRGGTSDARPPRAGGLMGRYGFPTMTQELNAQWIKGLNDYPSGEHWETFGEQLTRVFYGYFGGAD